MSGRFKLIIVIVIISIFTLLLLVLNDIRRTYLELGAIKSELIQIKEVYAEYQVLVNTVNNIDSKFTQELADAKNENNQRYHDIINNVGRLQFNTAPRDTNTTPSSMDDANACKLTGEARQNYYLLRDDIITKDKMILGLQAYINEICLKNP